jgi:hypothetical protein
MKSTPSIITQQSADELIAPMTIQAIVQKMLDNFILEQ